jgi:hypothetical protein
MDEAPAPTEWITGQSRGRWFVGFEIVFISTLFVASLGLDAGLSWTGASITTPKIDLVITLASGGISVGPMLLWVMLVPIPLSRVGVSPGGILIDYGLRTDRFPWSRALLRGERLEVVSRRLGLRTVYALTPYQASRIAFLQPAPS